ncbi:MAG: hypothetical protein ABFD13_01615 [Candidatus Cryosericum sp.]
MAHVGVLKALGFNGNHLEVIGRSGVGVLVDRGLAQVIPSPYHS